MTSLGGIGQPKVVDHLDPAQVERLQEEVRRDYGRIDILVNDIWGGEVLKGRPPEWNAPIWRHDLQKGLRILRLGVETHLITSHFLLPLLVMRPGGLLIEVTDGTAEYNASRYRISAFYDLAKSAVNRLAFSQGHELTEWGCAAVAITPGWLRSEMMLDNYGVTEANWRDALKDRGPGAPRAPPDFAMSETPRYVGRAVAALASDPERNRWNQKSVTSAELARCYGVTDIDGSQPDVWRRVAEARKGGVTAIASSGFGREKSTLRVTEGTAERARRAPAREQRMAHRWETRPDEESDNQAGLALCGLHARLSSSIISMEARTASWGRSKPAMTASPIVLTNQKIRVHVTNAFIQRSRLLQIGGSCGR